MANPSDELIELCRATVEAHQKATSVPYSKEAWAPWMEAAETFQAAVTAEAEASKENRFKLEQAAKKAVLHPEPTSE
ncbi:hypothetical protein [Streptomyces anulatus]|uniref:hypothetical protein n=1 Tax=Streptomyces anulatus TaxID=1892 RepID=UPI002ED636ED|nr:hypothetical protein OG882_04595 [Streptomyces anulatus]WUD92895.1 hypothetical protein OG703_34045 [Streptomyces anulatus]